MLFHIMKLVLDVKIHFLFIFPIQIYFKTLTFPLQFTAQNLLYTYIFALYAAIKQ